MTETARQRDFFFSFLSMGGQEPPIQSGGESCLDGRVLPGHGEKRELENDLIAAMCEIFPAPSANPFR
jgi:hypothetical protein